MRGAGRVPGRVHPGRTVLGHLGAAQARNSLKPQGQPIQVGIKPLRFCRSQDLSFALFTLFSFSLFFPCVSGGSFIPDQRYQTIFLESRSRNHEKTTITTTTTREYIKTKKREISTKIESSSTKPHFSSSSVFFPASCFSTSFRERRIAPPYPSKRRALHRFASYYQISTGRLRPYPSPRPIVWYFPWELRASWRHILLPPPSVAFVPHIRHRSSQTLSITSA